MSAVNPENTQSYKEQGFVPEEGQSESMIQTHPSELPSDPNPTQAERFWQKKYAGKPLFEWLEPIGAILIPVFIGILTISQTYYNSQQEQKQNERDQTLKEEQDARNLDNQRSEIMSNYIDRMTQLLEDKNLRTNPTDEVRLAAQMRTLITLPQLDGKRKGELLKFLYVARLIGQCPSVYDDKKPCNSLKSILRLDGAKLNDIEYELKRPPLSGIDLTSAILEKANFADVDLSRANISQANIEEANFSNAILTEAKMKKTNLKNINLSNATLLDVDLSISIIEKANLTNAVLMRANLQGSILQEVDLKGADLRGADLTVRNLKEVDFTNAIYNLETLCDPDNKPVPPTRFPKNFNPKGQGMIEKFDLKACPPPAVSPSN